MLTQLSASTTVAYSLDFTIIKMTILCALSLTLSYILMPLCLSVASVIGAIDTPDGERRINTRSVPRLGGLGFYAAFAFTLLIGGMLGDPTVNALLIGGGIIVAAGVSDDAFSLSPTVKLALQLAAALVALAFIDIPDRFTFFGIFSIPLSGVAGALFSLVRIIFSINAVNFSDGLDGLATGLSSVALLSLSLFGLSNDRYSAAFAALLLGFALIGFIPYNKYKAKIFMGDSGSQFLGYAIALLSLGCSSGGFFTVETSLFLAIPLLDAWLSIARRILKGKSPFAADKGHLHHLLLASGVSHPVAVRILVCSGAIIALVTLLFAI